MSAPQPGTMVAPNIRLERPLAQGGMGSVWVAQHLGLHTRIVVKFMMAEQSWNKELAERFSREAAAASQVKSAHVVQMLDYGTSPEGLAYIAMELLDGCSLESYLSAFPVVLPKQVAGVVEQAAKALDRAHARGIVHRDIKPANLFLCDMGDGEAFVKVLDFGVAKFRGGVNVTATATGALFGTPVYMSPEQVFDAKAVDHRADLWALAAVAYEMLTGSRLVSGDSLGAVAVSVTNGSFVPPTVRNPSLPARVDAWFARAFARNPDDRFSSARELAQALADAVGGREPLLFRDSMRVSLSSRGASEAAAPTSSNVATLPRDVQLEVGVASTVFPAAVAASGAGGLRSPPREDSHAQMANPVAASTYAAMSRSISNPEGLAPARALARRANRTRVVALLAGLVVGGLLAVFALVLGRNVGSPEVSPATSRDGPIPVALSTLPAPDPTSMNSAPVGGAGRTGATSSASTAPPAPPVPSALGSARPRNAPGSAPGAKASNTPRPAPSGFDPDRDWNP